MGGGSAPKPDKAMGEAAMMNAATGREYLNYMREQGLVASAWAEEDRERYKTVFRPIEDQLVADAQNWDTPERRMGRGNEAEADVIQGANAAQAAQQRNNAAMGVRPDSGRAASLGATSSLREGLARAGARNMAGRQVEAEGDARMASAANMGRGLAINPATSLGLAGNLTGAGFEGQMAGYQSQANILGQQHQAQMQGWQAQQQQSASIWGGLGSMAGLLLSSKDAKTDRQSPATSPRDQIDAMPVEEYRYRDGMGDGGSQQHIGPMAEDFHAATGRGDGRTIPMQDLMGTTIGAVQELSATVRDIQNNLRAMTAPAQGRSMAA